MFPQNSGSRNPKALSKLLIVPIDFKFPKYHPLRSLLRSHRRSGQAHRYLKRDLKFLQQRQQHLRKSSLAHEACRFAWVGGGHSPGQTMLRQSSFLICLSFSVKTYQSLLCSLPCESFNDGSESLSRSRSRSRSWSNISGTFATIDAALCDRVGWSTCEIQEDSENGVLIRLWKMTSFSSDHDVLWLSTGVKGILSQREWTIPARRPNNQVLELVLQCHRFVDDWQKLFSAILCPKNMLAASVSGNASPSLSKLR